MQGSSIDSAIATLRGRRRQERSLQSDQMKLLQTQAGTLRILDTGGNKQPLMMVPDGPCVLEHYADLIELLSPDFRVVCFDLPGFGFSYPAFGFDFSVSKMADTVVEVMDLLNIPCAVLAFTCANSFFALHVAKHHPERVSHLILGQTPSLQAMRQWDDQMIPKLLHVPYVGQMIMAGLTRKISVGWYDRALPKRSEQKAQFTLFADQALKSGGCFCLASFVQGLSKTQDCEISDVSTPTLLIHSNKDLSHRQTNFSSLRDHVPTADIMTFKGCGHFPDLERPQAYAKQIKQFVYIAA
ncbi:MAG: alpha/beta hydrolase [Thermosynechococcaceae cyanobacterium]